MNFKKSRLDLSNSSLTEIPGFVFETKRLYKLNLSNNKIKTLPKEIEQLRYLEVLNLSGNKIRTVLAKLFELPRLKILILDNNHIIHLPKQVAKLKHLKILSLAKNQLPFLPFEIGDLTNLVELNISGNRFEEINFYGSEFPNLKALWISNNPVKDFFREEIYRACPRLKSLYCYGFNEHTSTVSLHSLYAECSLVKGNCLTYLKNIVAVSVSEKIPVNVEPISQIKMKNKIFISYSHADKEWLQKLQKHLKVLSIQIRLEVWDDTRLQSGDKWKVEIEKALEDANIAILLVSTDFLASDFIRTNELPPILKNAESKGTRVMPLLVRPSLFTSNSELSQFQAVNDPVKTIIECTPSEQERVFIKVCHEIQASMVSR